MKYYAVNGSPRKNFNTSALLDCALQGIKDICPDAEVKRIDVYDYAYSGCISCYACKRVNGASYGRCAKKDGITELLAELSQADGMIIGSPVYFHDITGQLRCLLERLLYPYLVYSKEYSSIAPKHMPTALIYTMNATEEKMERMNYEVKLSAVAEYVEAVFSRPEVLYCCDTCQFHDCSLYRADRFSEEEKKKRKRTQFPLDCKEAFEIGRRMVQAAKCPPPTAEGIPGRT